MKLTLRGLRRSVYTHYHRVEPLYAKRGRKSVVFHDGRKVRGVVKQLSLSGDFFVDIEFTEPELRSWLKSYIDCNPRKARRLLFEIMEEVAEEQECAFHEVVEKCKKHEKKSSRCMKEIASAADRLQIQWYGASRGSDREKQIEAILNPLKQYLSDHVR